MTTLNKIINDFFLNIQDIYIYNNNYFLKYFLFKNLFMYQHMKRSENTKQK
jgi:hypothetical protein